VPRVTTRVNRNVHNELSPIGGGRSGN